MNNTLNTARPWFYLDPSYANQPIFLDPNYIPKNGFESLWHFGMMRIGNIWMFVTCYTIMFLLYLLSGAFFWVLEQMRFLPQYRLQPGVCNLLKYFPALQKICFLLLSDKRRSNSFLQKQKWPTNKDYMKTIKNIFTNYVLVILPLVFGFAPFAQYLGIRGDTPFPPM